MNRHLVIIAATVFVILAGILLTVYLHHENKMEVLSQLQDRQLLHAQHLVHQIKSFFHARSEELQALSSLVSRENSGLRKKRGDIEACSKMMEFVKTISLYNGSGAIAYSTDSNAIGLDHSDREFFSWAKKKENKGKVFGTSLFQPDSFIYLLAVPLYEDSFDKNYPEPSGKFIGALTVSVDLKEFLANQLDFLDSEMNLHQVWIMDRDGKLLFQSEHKEMVQRNIYQKEESCQQCHTSFDYAEKILKGKQGIAGYKLKDLPEKIAAFAPMDFENVSWIVVISSAYNNVAALTKKSLQEHLGLLGIVILATILGSASIIRVDRLKVRAEEEVRRWREKRVLEDKIQQSEVRYRTIVESAHDIIWTLDAQGNFTTFNRSGEEISGYTASELIGKSFVPLVYPEDLPMVQDLHVKIFRGEEASGEARVYAKDGSLFTLSVNAAPLFENDRVIGMAGFGRDITEHKKAEEALRKNEEKYRTLVETMNEGLTVLDENDRWTYVNDKFCYMLGYFSGEFVGHSVFEFLDEINQKILEEQLSKRRNGEYSSYEIEWARKDGTNIPTIVSPKPIFDPEGRFKGSLAIVTDITERKRNELALRESENQLRYLSSKLLTIQEQERKRISAELHDELGQALAVMKLRLKSIERGLSKDQTAIRDECNSTLHYINEVIENVRRLSRDLSPSILEDLGLSSALRWMLDEFTKVYHIDVTLEMAEIDHLFSRKAQVILYRIFQEALTNIGKHAQATRVSIVIKKDEDKISFSVEDDGKGFDLSRAARRDMTPKGIGLATMNERVRMLGGSLHLMSQKTGGTRITFTVPPDGGNAE